MTDNLKREFISKLLDNSIEKAKTQLAAIGISGDVFDSIDKLQMVTEMEAACEISGEHLLEIDSFLASERFKQYEESLFKMSEVVFRFATKDVEGSTSKVIH